jgi:proteasome lid subunit RPN8/RPN11
MTMPTANKLIILESVWEKLIVELRKRGDGERESGAFLLGKFGENQISEFVCYNDLDPNCLDHGIITFDGSGYIPLWQMCKENSLTVLADVHTHPGSWVGQSRSDSSHPMIAQSGHIAIILPEYAHAKNLRLKDAGIYEYRGDKKWKTVNPKGGRVRILK